MDETNKKIIDLLRIAMDDYNKIICQVDHVLNVHTGDMLKLKLNDLVIEWYFKGIHKGWQSYIDLMTDNDDG